MGETNLGDVLLNPLQHQALIQETCVQVSVFPDFFAGEEPPQTDSIVEVDKNNVSIRYIDELRPIPVRIRVLCVAYCLLDSPSMPPMSLSGVEYTSSLDEYHDWQL